MGIQCEMDVTDRPLTQHAQWHGRGQRRAGTGRAPGGVPTPEAPPNAKPSNPTCPSWDGGDYLLLRLHNTQQRISSSSSNTHRSVATVCYESGYETASCHARARSNLDRLHLSVVVSRNGSQVLKIPVISLGSPY